MRPLCRRPAREAFLTPAVPMAVRVGGAAACPVPRLGRARGGGAALPAARSASFSSGTRCPSRLKVPSSSSPCSQGGWALRCLPDPARGAEMVTKEGRNGGKAWRLFKTAMAGIFGPFFRNVTDILALSSVYDLEDYNLGLLFGAILGFLGCYKLFQGIATPYVFMDILLGFLFYGLSVLSSDMRRLGKPNELYTRLKSGLVVIMAIKEFKKGYEIMDILRHEKIWKALPHTYSGSSESQGWIQRTLENPTLSWLRVSVR